MSPVKRLALLLVVLTPSLLRAQEPAPATPAPPPAALTKAPKLLHFVKAEPPPALADRKQADVVLTIDIDEHGQVQSVAVAKPAGDGFDEAALAAVKQFEFSPGESNGKPVPVRITYRYRFLYEAPPPPPPPPPPPVEGQVPPPPLVPTVPFAGTILQRGDRQPLPGVTVIVDDDVQRAITDLDGKFAFEALPVGDHVLKLRGTAVAKAADVKLTLESGKLITKTYFVEGRNRYQSTVRGARIVEETVEQRIAGDELRKIPGTQGDTLKAVQNLPGVARAPFGLGLIVVWGSSPQDTRSYVDGVFIPTLFHFGGLRSTVNSEIVNSLSFYPGGYSVEHGRGLGGAIEVETRAPRADGVHGFVQIDLIDASFMLEAKLTKNLSIAVGGRRSLIDTWLGAVTPNNIQATPVYYDYQLKLHWHASPRDEVDVFFFGSDDQLKVILRRPDPSVSGQFDTHTFYHRALVKYLHRFGKTTLTITPSVGFDSPIQGSGSVGNNSFFVDAKNIGYGLRAVVRVPFTSWLRLDAGVDFEGNRYDISAHTPATAMPREGDPPGFRNNGVLSTSATLYINNTAPYVGLNFTLFDKRVTINPQLRLDVYSFSGYGGTPDQFNNTYVEAEPRLALRWQIRKWVALKGSIGVFHQPPDNSALLKGFGDPNLKPSFATHYVMGPEFDPTPTLHIEVLGFYKDLRQLTVRGQAGDPILTNDGIGRVYGGELLVKQELFKNFFGWISYTLSRSERRDHPGDPWRIFQYDQTHIFTIIGSYRLPRGYQVGVRFRYVTGNPYTPIIGSYFDANRGEYRSVAGELYSQRLSDFHQLDLRFDKTWTFQQWKLSLYLDIQNLYYSKPEEGRQPNYDYTKFEPIAGLPIVPALGIRGDF